ncbi:Parafibromin [Thelohanellus kitauei]|uniref:Parafibromin n=1 Tax=Thelohanellus kitauei TaxID=669202 RepID=A0A0C2MQ43_THEKT|nr:Parafibromin [Thelohanellus kitauei]
MTYNRYDQERFGSMKETAGFKINTLGSFKGLMTKIDSNPGHDSIANPNANGSLVGDGALGSGSFDPKATPTLTPAKRESKTPIIVVPKASVSLINLNTIASFIQDFKLDINASNENARDGHVLVYRRREKAINGQLQMVSIPYVCLDSTDKLSGSDWNRVVAVFVHGPTWQFKGWPFVLPDNCPSEIFTRIHAFHVKYSDAQLDPQIAKWNVKVLEILRNSRHMDRAAAVTFWDSLESFISRNKPNLRF